MRELHEARERATVAEQERARALERRAAEHKRNVLQAQIQALQEELAAAETDAASAVSDDLLQQRQAEDDRHQLAISRRTQTNGEGNQLERHGERKDG